MSEKHDDVTSSKVSLHPKENELEGLCSLSKMSLSEATVSPQSNVEGETKECLPEISPSELVRPQGDKILRRKKGLKEKIGFRARNGAVYQLPLTEKESVDERNQKTSNADNLSKEMPNYFEILRKTVKAEIKESKERKPSKIPVTNPRWNKKHQREIEQDKRSLQSWFEHGIDSRAYAPKSSNNDSESEQDNSERYVNRLRVKKQPTLGDYVPSFKLRTENSGSQPAVNDSQPAVNDSQPANESMSYELEDESTSPWELALTAQQCERLRNVLRDTRYQSQMVCKEFYSRVGEPYPGCCGPLNDPNIDSECGEKESLTSVLKDLKRYIEYFTSFSGFDNEEYTHLTYTQGKMPLCIHGIRYQIKRCCEAIISEGIALLDLLPEDQVTFFSQEFRRLISSIDNTQKCHMTKKLVPCMHKFCRWEEIDIPVINVRERMLYHSSTPKNDMIAFEVKRAQVSSIYRRIDLTLGTEVIEKEKYVSPYKYSRAMKEFDISKSELMSNRLNQLMNVVYRETFLLMESLPRQEVKVLRENIDMFNFATYEMRDKELRKKILRVQSESPYFGESESRWTNYQSSTASDEEYDVPALPDSLPEQRRPAFATKAEKQDHPSETVRLERMDFEYLTKLSNSPLGHFETPKQLSPAIRVECCSPSWLYHVRGKDGTHMVFDDHGEAVEYSVALGIDEQKEVQRLAQLCADGIKRLHKSHQEEKSKDETKN
jgi:hypothetical protein